MIALDKAELAFVEWWKSGPIGGTQFLELAYFDDGVGGSYRGLKATQDVPEGSRLFAVPLALCIQSVLPSDQDWHGSTSNARLILRLLEETARGPASPLHPYISTLPPPTAVSSGASNLPAATLASHVQSYRPLLTRQSRLEALDDAARPHVLARLNLQPDDAAGRKSYAWAAYVSRTRAFSAASGPSAGSAGAKDLDLLVPVLDMLNHKHEGYQVDWAWSAAERAIVATAVRPLAAGEQAFDNYGDREDDAWLLSAGFIPPGRNQPNTCEVFADLRDAARWWVGAAHVLWGGKAGSGAVRLPAAEALAAAIDDRAREEEQAEGAPEGEVKQGVCLGPEWNADDRLVDLFEGLAEAEPALGSKQAERAALRAVQLRCAQLLEDAPTSAEEDTALLAKMAGATAGAGSAAPALEGAGGRDGLLEACILFRLRKKQILEGYLG